MKITLLLSIVTMLFLQTAAAAELRKVNFTKGPELFRNGDSIQIREIESKSGTFEVGDEVVIRGIYDLQSKPAGTISVFVTSKGSGKSKVLPGQQLKIARGTGEFELKMTVRTEGFLHLSFYPAGGGSAFGGIYFGSENQMKQIADWDLSYYLKEK